MELHVKVCYQSVADREVELTSLGCDCDHDQGPDGIFTVDERSVNAVPGGDGGHGTVVADNTVATYTAPATAPSLPTVAVSGLVHVAQTGGPFKKKCFRISRSHSILGSEQRPARTNS